MVDSATAATTRSDRRKQAAAVIAAPIVWASMRNDVATVGEHPVALVEDAPVASTHADDAVAEQPRTRRERRHSSSGLSAAEIHLADDALVLEVVDEPTAAAPIVEVLEVAEPDVDVTVEPLPTVTVEATPMPASAPTSEPVAEAASEVPVEDAPFELEEPVVEVVEAPAATDEREDAFVAAARLFSFTGENPVIRPVPVDRSAAASGMPVPEAPASVESLPVSIIRARGNRKARRTAARRKASPARQIAAASFTVGVMGAVGMLTVAMAAPAEAVAAAVKTDPVTSIQAPAQDAEQTAEIQAYVSPENVELDLGRESENYSTATFSDIAAANGITRHTNFFVNDPNGEIQWPFAVGVPISDGYGPRWGGMHRGLDFTPGEGAEIQAVAAGTVRIANESGGAFGVHVMIDHEIDGEVFSTHYAHMLYGSLKVQAGDKVEAGTILGNVGDTGLSYGAHLHFEVFVNNDRIDPLPWLREHAGG